MTAQAAGWLSLTPDGQVLVTLKAEWHDGTTHLLLGPVELLEKLAALTPRTRVNLVIYHGVLAPHARWRARVVSYGAPVVARDEPSAKTADEYATPERSRRYWKWADLMRRAFELDVLACPRYGGRMQLIATIDDPAIVRKILERVHLSADLPEVRPAAGRRRPPLSPAVPEPPPGHVCARHTAPGGESMPWGRRPLVDSRFVRGVASVLGPGRG